MGKSMTERIGALAVRNARAELGRGTDADQRRLAELEAERVRLLVEGP